MSQSVENMSTIPFYWEVLKESVYKFSDDDLFTYAAALSYYTVFSLPPMLLIILFTTTRFYDEATIKEAIFGQIGNLVGRDGAIQLMATIEKLNVFSPSIWTTIFGIAVLIFTSTTVFVTFQNILNKIFRVKAKPEGWAILKLARDRALSFALLIGVAFILLVSLVVNAVIEAFGSFLQKIFGEVSFVVNMFTTVLMPLFVITILFAMMFRYLPDTKLEWKDTWFGAIITSVLFVLGKYLISFYIGNSDVAGLYDAAGSVMVIMVWVFYASIIIMFGAVFTYTRKKLNGERMPAIGYAVKVVYKEIEKEPLPANPDKPA